MIASLLISLALAIIIELSVSLILGIRGKEDIQIIIVANLLTNPIVVYLVNCFKLINNDYIYYTVIAVLEIAAVLFETMIYKKYLISKKLSTFKLSVINNIVSFCLGIPIGILIGMPL